MEKPRLTDVASAIEKRAPLGFQESYDNSGWQVLCDPAGRCSGVMLCVDCTPAVVDEAARRGCNLIVSHHPVLFRGQKCFAERTPVERTVMDAIRVGVSIYSSHTALDSAPGGVSAEMARMLGLLNVIPLNPHPGNPSAGLGAVGSLAEPLSAGELVERVKGAFAEPVVRCSRVDNPIEVSRVALCGGSGSEFVEDAIRCGAQAFITSDTRHHTFVDFGPQIFIIDLGHWSAEACSRSLLESIIKSAFPELTVLTADADRSPIIYL